MSSLESSTIYSYARVFNKIYDESLKIDKNSVHIYKSSDKSYSSFFFDKVFGSDTTQYDFFQEFEPLVQQIIKGTNITLLLVGESEVNKMFTLRGLLDNPGLLVRFLERLFELKNRNKAALKLSIKRVDNNLCYDVISNSEDPVNNQREFTELEIKETGDILKFLDYGNISTLDKHGDTEKHKTHFVIYTIIYEIKDFTGQTNKFYLDVVNTPKSQFINKSMSNSSVQTTFNLINLWINNVESNTNDKSIRHPLIANLDLHYGFNSKIILLYNLESESTNVDNNSLILNFYFNLRKEFNYKAHINYLKSENIKLKNKLNAVEKEKENMQVQLNNINNSGVTSPIQNPYSGQSNLNSRLSFINSYDLKTFSLKNKNSNFNLQNKLDIHPNVMISGDDVKKNLQTIEKFQTHKKLFPISTKQKIAFKSPAPSIKPALRSKSISELKTIPNQSKSARIVQTKRQNSVTISGSATSQSQRKSPRRRGVQYI